ncbi:MAG: DinB family protein [Planctomycetota bacterium]|nr:DinB family protein [Planctomycetota bacterium]
MSTPEEILGENLVRSLSGLEAHVDTVSALEGLTCEVAGRWPTSSPHSIYQLVNHLIYWQEYCLAAIDGNDPPPPEHASDGWPGKERPASADEWEGTVARFRRGLQKASSPGLFMSS